MGKNFSLSTNPNRNKSDFYQTPYNITRRLLEVEKFEGSILEPANGAGAITTILKEFGYQNITAYDLIIDGVDFLTETRKFDNIITNPPYSQNKLERVYVFTRYPMLSAEIRPDGKYKTGMMVYAWYIFDVNYCGEPIIKWLDNNEDCINLKG